MGTKKIMKKLVLAFCLLAVPHIFYSQTEFIGRSEIKYLNWGGTIYGWNNLFLLKNTVTAHGPQGSYYLHLADNSPIEDENTDILLHFDYCSRDNIFFESSTYKSEEIDIFPSTDIKKFGHGAAGFLHYQHTVKLKPLEGSIFTQKGPFGSFSIDFWLFSTSVHEGSVVFARHAPVLGHNGGFTGIKAFFQGGRLHWLFEKVFRDRLGQPFDILLTENTKVLLNEWHHHALCYDSTSGLMTIYYDGKESNLQWITEDGTEDGTLLQGFFSPHLSIPFAIGENFFGYIDEFRISRGPPSFSYGDFRNFGEVRSDVLTLKSRGTKIVEFVWKSIEEKGTAVRLFYRLSHTYFPPDAEEDLLHGVPSWIQVSNNQELLDGPTGGEYFQWKAELYGTKGMYTPYLHSLRVMLELDPPPAAPILLKATPLNTGVMLSWVKNKESDIHGYKVYYGTSPGYYFGKESNKGDSPILVGDVNSVLIKGLKNEEVYFFSITAVDRAEQESGFSAELVVRPSGIYGDQ